ncbi:hypothetical protein Syun_015049 [Stephania yunnanensis]|uniref:Uncharacterized protein n=1 Tax=Stephania yunnanensis TaxID=152371 RepID=A0AAP0JKT7_9MAGN
MRERERGKKERPTGRGLTEQLSAVAPLARVGGRRWRDRVGRRQAAARGPRGLKLGGPICVHLFSDSLFNHQNQCINACEIFSSLNWHGMC